MTKEFERIIAPVDGSEAAKKAAKKALAFAKLCNIDVVAMNVINILNLPPPYVYMHELLQKEGQTYLDEIEEWGKQTGVTVSKKLVEGHPAEEIIKEAKEDDLIVIGSKGRTGIDRVLLGSVAENVARHAPCPVMIVK
jgi:nucleotide-binding universal stress UspA family protein